MEIIALVIAIFSLVVSLAIAGNTGKLIFEHDKKIEDDGRYKQKIDLLEKTLQEVTEMLPQVLVHLNTTKAEISELVDDYTITREVVQDHEKFLTTGKQPRKGDRTDKETTIH